MEASGTFNSRNLRREEREECSRALWQMKACEGDRLKEGQWGWSGSNGNRCREMRLPAG